MVDAWLPYGKSQICIRIPIRNFLGSIEPVERTGMLDARAEFERALKEPLGTRKLSDIVKPDSKIAIAAGSLAGSVSSDCFSVLLDMLNKEGAKDENVTVIFPCNADKPVETDEGVKILGETVSSRVKKVSHDPLAGDLVNVGKTKNFGTEVFLNRTFMESDVRILTGEIGLHRFAGYSGGSETVLPGLSGEETVRHNHALLMDTNARIGLLAGNPVHQDMVEAAALAKVDFAVNVVMNCKREMVRAFAGEPDQVFIEGVKLLDEMCRVQVDRRADIVVVSPGGDPFDSNLFSACSSVETATDVVKRGGVIILAAELAEGHGNQDFYDWMTKCPDLKTVEKEIKHNFAVGGAAAYSCMKTFQKARVILVSSMPDFYAATVFKMKTARAVNAALDQAMNIVGNNARIWVMPYGNCTLPEVKIIEDQSSSIAAETKSV